MTHDYTSGRGIGAGARVAVREVGATPPRDVEARGFDDGGADSSTALWEP